MRLILQMPCAEYCRLWGFSWGFIVFVIFSGVFDVEGVFMALLLVLIVSWQFAFLSPPKSAELLQAAEPTEPLQFVPPMPALPDFINSNDCSLCWLDSLMALPKLPIL